MRHCDFCSTAASWSCRSSSLTRSGSTGSSAARWTGATADFAWKRFQDYWRLRTVVLAQHAPVADAVRKDIRSDLVRRCTVRDRDPETRQLHHLLQLVVWL